MKLKPFKLERYFAKYEFTAKYLLSSSDCDGLMQSDLLELADDETVKLWKNLSLGYTESLGLLLLREEISHLYQGITPDDCLVIVPEEGIFIAVNSILHKGDHVICTFPGYQSLYAIAEGLGCQVTKWLPEEENNWRFNPHFLEKNIRSNTKLIIVNFPHNPTGYLPPKNDYELIIDLARKNNIHLFSDEMYRFLEYDRNERLPSACEMYEKAVSLFGMSKNIGMSGVRIGWLVNKYKNLFKNMAAFKDYTTICSSAPCEILSIIALRSRQKIINRHISRIKINLSLLDAFFDHHQDRFEWVKPKAGTIGFPRLKGEIDSWEFCQRLIQATNIMLLPSTEYDFDDRHFRIGFGRENMPEALAKLSEYVSALNN